VDTEPVLLELVDMVALKATLLPQHLLVMAAVLEELVDMEAEP